MVALPHWAWIRLLPRRTRRPAGPATSERANHTRSGLAETDRFDIGRRMSGKGAGRPYKLLVPRTAMLPPRWQQALSHECSAAGWAVEDCIVLTLFYASRSRSTRIVCLLEELGIPDELRHVAIRYMDGSGDALSWFCYRESIARGIGGSDVPIDAVAKADGRSVRRGAGSA